jgi:hypothetical protein
MYDMLTYDRCILQVLAPYSRQFGMVVMKGAPAAFKRREYMHLSRHTLPPGTSHAATTGQQHYTMQRNCKPTFHDTGIAGLYMLGK